MKANKTYMQAALVSLSVPMWTQDGHSRSRSSMSIQKSVPNAQGPYIHLDQGFIYEFKSHAYSWTCARGMDFAHWFRPRL